MITATVEDVQARLPEMLDRLAPGETVVITRHGKPVARLLSEEPPPPSAPHGRECERHSRRRSGRRRTSEGLRGVHGMRALLDTHTFLWFILDDPQLSTAARAAIEDPLNDIEVSPASYWEIASKIKLGKYVLPQPYEMFMTEQIAVNDFHVLHIEPRHTALLTTMELHHKDPFDRLLIAQAVAEDIPLSSADTAFDPYPVRRLW